MGARASQIIVISLLLSGYGYVWGKYSGGAGSAADPYQISNATDLLILASETNDYDANFILTADISLSGYTFSTAVISNNVVFTGTFNGDNHTISNLAIDTGGAYDDYLGLFGKLDSSARVTHLNLDAISISCGEYSEYIGGLAGWNSGMIENCHTSGDIISDENTSLIGGLVGYNKNGSIINCSNDANLTGEGGRKNIGKYIGGLAGANMNGRIECCYNSADITGERAIGGVVGWNEGDILNCYNSGELTGSYYTGGLTGYNVGNISNCYSTGISPGSGSYQYLGGLIGYGMFGNISHSFWDTQTSGTTISSGGVGLTTSQMQTADTFNAWGFCGSAGAWTIDNGRDYPRLYWENAPGAPITGPELSEILSGTGAPLDPYLIYSADDLAAMSLYHCEYGKHFKLMADVDMSLTVFETAIIAADFNNSEGFQGVAFNGVFDGNGYVIQNLTINTNEAQNDYLGLFGQIGSLARVKNLYLENAVITGVVGSYYLGALAGVNEGDISYCFSTGEINGGSSYQGGLAGINKGHVRECFSQVNVTGNSVDHGGLVGKNEGDILNCYSTGNVVGYTYVGGLVGYNLKAIRNCYCLGQVSGDSKVGGLVGYDYSDASTYCFWDTQTSEATYSAGGAGLPTAQMQQAVTYYYWGICGSGGVWTIADGLDYPHLTWENKPGDIITHPTLSDLLEGTGTLDDPYLIYTAEDLSSMADYICDYDKSFKLMADIDMNPTGGNILSCAPITENTYFTGHFDGNNHIIHNLTINSTNDYLGLFGKIGEDAHIHHLILENVHITGGSNSSDVGGLAGINKGTIDNCQCIGSISGNEFIGGLCGYNNGQINACHTEGFISGSGSSNNSGGLVGRNQEGYIDYCSSSCSISGAKYVGGLVGYSYGGNVNHSYSSGEITGGNYAGGLIGYCNYSQLYSCYSDSEVNGGNYLGGLAGLGNDTIINCCYSTGNVTGGDYLGGLVGYQNGGGINNCYCQGNIAGDENIGGLIGYLYRSMVLNCYSIGLVQGDAEIGGLVGKEYSSSYVAFSFWDTQASGITVSADGVGLDTDQMQSIDTYSEWGYCEHRGVWTIDDGNDYPRLAWENQPGVAIAKSELDEVLAGAGAPDDPYLIYTHQDLLALSDYPCEYDRHYKLMADIDLNQAQPPVFTTAIIAPNSTSGGSGHIQEFTGVFDGNGHVIRNLTIQADESNDDYLGLFGYLGKHAQVKNLSVENVSISVTETGYAYHLGMLAGRNEGQILNCHSTGNIVGNSRSDYLGGLCGSNYGDIVNCYSIGDVVNGDNVGGLCGIFGGGAVSNCHASGSVTSEGMYLGGLCGYVSSGEIYNCYVVDSIINGHRFLGGLCGCNNAGVIHECFSSNSSIDGDDYIGGLCGYIDTGKIKNCYAENTANGADHIGGLVGSNNKGEIYYCYSRGQLTGEGAVGGLVGADTSNDGVRYCFWDTQTSGVQTSAGGTGLNTMQMQDAETYYTWGICGNEGVWTIDDGIDYPRLAWENATGANLAFPQISEILDGAGTMLEPYRIYTASDFLAMGRYTCDYDKSYQLMNDIDLNPTGADILPHAPIAAIESFTGHFDGNGYIIRNLTINSSGSYLGLFGKTASSARIQNVILENVNSHGGEESDYVGGLVGDNMGVIENCRCTADVSGNTQLGGLVGRNNEGHINYCCSYGNITGVNQATYTYIGGLVGYNAFGAINNCYSQAAVSGEGAIGGLVGYFASGTIINGYSAGRLTGGTDPGGLVGRGVSVSISHGFWDIQTSGMATSYVGIGFDTAHMQMASTYLAWSVCDNKGIWTIDEGNDYPHLAWENMPGEVLARPELSEILAGTGSRSDPYLVYTPEELTAIKHYTCEYDKYYKLMADIDMNVLSPNTFTEALIAPYYSRAPYTDFTGVFDGNGHVIRNLSSVISDQGSSYLGLFGRIGSSAMIANLILEDVSITGSGAASTLGGLAGFNSGVIYNCYCSGHISSGSKLSYAGGLCGSNRDGGYISHCYADVSITGGGKSSCVGGLCGISYISDVSHCRAYGSVTCGIGSDRLGGLCGESSGSVSNCYARGDVSGQRVSYEIGGLCGDYYGAITNCYSTGQVSGANQNGRMGGLCSGYNDDGVSNCYFLITAGPDNGVGQPLDEGNMKLQSSYLGWDFAGDPTDGSEDNWRMCYDNVDYPHLNWEYQVRGDFACPDGIAFEDFAFFAGCWLDDDCISPDNCQGVDMDASGQVDSLDFILWLENWLN